MTKPSHPPRFETEIAFFKSKLPEWLKHGHEGRWACIVGSKLVGLYDDPLTAFNAGVADVGASTPFLVEQVLEKPRAPEISTLSMGLIGAQATMAAPAAGALVGDTATQTLSNKTLDSTNQIQSAKGHRFWVFGSGANSGVQTSCPIPIRKWPLPPITVAPDRILGPNAHLELLGPRIQVIIGVPAAVEKRLIADGKPVPDQITGLALIDTGATQSCADHEALSKGLGLQPIGTVTQHGVHGPEDSEVFACGIAIPGMGRAEMPRVQSARLKGTGLLALLGRDFLHNRLMIYDGGEGSFTICR